VKVVNYKLEKRVETGKDLFLMESGPLNSYKNFVPSLVQNHENPFLCDFSQ
jgi:hypothetical protein